MGIHPQGVLSRRAHGEGLSSLQKPGPQDAGKLQLVAVLGATEAEVSVLAELHRHPQVHVVGLWDADPDLVGQELAEILGLGAGWLHVCGIALIAGRLIHPFGITEENSPLAPRVVGVLATMAAILIPAGSILLTQLT